jgi:hypothetical protein
MCIAILFFFLHHRVKEIRWYLVQDIRLKPRPLQSNSVRKILLEKHNFLHQKEKQLIYSCFKTSKCHYTLIVFNFCRIYDNRKAKSMLNFLLCFIQHIRSNCGYQSMGASSSIPPPPPHHMNIYARDRPICPFLGHKTAISILKCVLFGPKYRSGLSKGAQNFWLPEETWGCRISSLVGFLVSFLRRNDLEQETTMARNKSVYLVISHWGVICISWVTRSTFQIDKRIGSERSS